MQIISIFRNFILQAHYYFHIYQLYCYPCFDVKTCNSYVQRNWQIKFVAKTMSKIFMQKKLKYFAISINLLQYCQMIIFFVQISSNPKANDINIQPIRKLVNFLLKKAQFIFKISNFSRQLLKILHKFIKKMQNFVPIHLPIWYNLKRTQERFLLQKFSFFFNNKFFRNTKIIIATFCQIFNLIANLPFKINTFCKLTTKFNLKQVSWLVS